MQDSELERDMGLHMLASKYGSQNLLFYPFTSKYRKRKEPAALNYSLSHHDQRGVQQLERNPTFLSMDIAPKWARISTKRQLGSITFLKSVHDTAILLYS
jgi:hypothetical protein